MSFSFAVSGVADWTPAAPRSSRSVLEHVFLDSAREHKWEVVQAFVQENAVSVNCQPAARFTALHQEAEAMMRLARARVCVCLCVCVWVLTFALCITHMGAMFRSCALLVFHAHLLCVSRTSALLLHRPAMRRWSVGCCSKVPTPTLRTSLVSAPWTALPHARFMCVCVMHRIEREQQCRQG